MAVGGYLLGSQDLVLGAGLGPYAAVGKPRTLSLVVPLTAGGGGGVPVEGAAAAGGKAEGGAPGAASPAGGTKPGPSDVG